MPAANQRYISGYASLCAPIRKLPPEIFQQIFILVCDENYVGNTAPLRIPAVALSQVCLFWNELVKIMPRLWATITFDAYDARNLHASTNLETGLSSGSRSSCSGSESGFSSGNINLHLVLKHLLDRSGSVPLCLTINLWTDDILLEDEYDKRHFEAVELLARHSYRWLTVSINVWCELLEALLWALEPIRGKLPLLKHLDFDAGFHDCCSDLFKDAPRLRSSGLFSSSANPCFLTLPWTQLEVLALTDPTTRYAPLALCPQLKDITFGGYDRSMNDPSDPDSEEDPVKLSSDVETFSLGISVLTDFNILNDLTFPSLTSFTMFSMDDFGQDCDALQEYYLSTLDPITSFFARSSCVLTCLNWSNMPTTIAAFISLLTILPSLTSLSISEEKRQNRRRLISDKFFKKLQIKPASSPTSSSIFLSNLETLSLVAKRTLDFSDSLVDAIESRRLPNENTGVKCLKAVTIKTQEQRFKDCKYFNGDIITKFKALAELGIKIVVKDKSGVILC